jgi:GNAT superfamily N-acetyltransferase
MNIAVRDVESAAHCMRTQHIKLQLATARDAPRIAQMFGVWFPMSIWRDCLTYDATKAASWIARGIASGCVPFVLALDGDELVGAISWHLDSRFTEPIGVLDEVFVLPRLQRSDLGRRLIHMAMHIAREEGARVFNFPVCSGMPAQQSLINMLTRHIGAEPVGVILRKVL